jgi:cytochrome c-type biogenesis protein
MFGDLHIYFGVMLAGLVSFLSPCVLPLVPPYLGYLGGTTISQASVADGIDGRVWRRVVIGSLFFVLGFTTVFTALGAGASMFGQLIQTYKGELSVAAGAVIILFGLHFTGVFKIPLLYSEARFQANVDGASFAGAYLIGLAFAFGWTPCIGPVLGAILALAGASGTASEGAALLAAYSAGLGIPFLVAALFVSPFMAFLQRFRSHLGTVEKIMGGLLVLTGIAFLTGGMQTLSFWLLETFPALGRLG